MALAGFLYRWQHILLAVLGGVLWAASFPKIGLGGAAWLSAGFILFAGRNRSGKAAFRAGYVAGLVHYPISLYWLLFIPFLSGAIAGWVALSLYLSVYPALWVWLCWKIAPADDPKHWSAAQVLGWTLGCAAMWVSLEMVLTRFLTGFPWNLLGVSQYNFLPIAQIATVTGVYGVSFLLVWFGVSIATVGYRLASNPRDRLPALLPAAVPCLAVAVIAAAGFRTILRNPVPARELKVALIQPSIPQTLIWDEKENTNRFQQLLRLTETALAAKPDLLLWPEAAVPTMLRYNEETARAVVKLAREHKVWMILGSDDAEPKTTGAGTKPSDYRFYNSSFVIDDTGAVAGVYKKRKLVIFGEYVPLGDIFPFMRHLTPVGENTFTPGEKASEFLLPDLRVKTAVLICFEDAFPDFTRGYVKEDTDFLINLTNNGWFGESAAQWQHGANAVFRAIENRVPLVRCANNGLSCMVDEVGRLYDVYFGDTGDIYGAGFKIVKVPLRAPGEKRPLTFYTQHGDVFGWFCVVVSCLHLARARFLHPKKADA